MNTVKLLSTFSLMLPAALIFLPAQSIAGPGLHGAKVINTSNVILNEFTTLTADVPAGSTTIAVANSGLNANARFMTPLTSGELVMIIQMQGVTMNTASVNSILWGSIVSYNNAGLYEFSEVLSVPNGTSI